MKSEKPGVHYPRLADAAETAVVEADATPEEETVNTRFFDSSQRVVLGATAAILIAFIAAVVFAAFVPLNRGAVAGGRIEATGSRNVVQHLDGGVVEKILVKEGQRVKAGQLLVKLDDRTAILSLNLLEEQRRLLMMEQAALEAESAGRSVINWPPEVLQAANLPSTMQGMRTNQALLTSRVMARNSEKSVLQEQIARLQEHAQGLQSQKQGLIEQLRLIKVETSSLEDLYAKGLTTRTRILALQRNAADLQGSIGTTDAAINQDRVQEGENRLRILGLDSAMQQENSKRLADLQKQIFELNDRISSQQLVVQRTAITSPSNGIVLNRAVNSVGMVIRPGEPVVEIVPDERLIVKANVKPQDIESVHVGADAVVKLTGLNVQTTPRLKGKITYISADALTDKEGKISYYEARVSISQSELAKIHDTVTPGMPAEILIDAGARTALQYLLQPITLAFSHAFRE